MKKKIILIAMLSLIIVLSIAPTMCVSQSNNSDNNAFGEYLTEFNSGIVIKANNENEKHEIASMVKIMTALLTFEAVERGQISLEQMVSISSEASSMGGSQMFLDTNAEYSVSDLIKGVIVVSANDASVALAELIAGGHSSFVNMMNSRAQELGMVNTKFVNATGLPSQQEQYSTAKDVNIMTRQLMKHPKYFDYAKIWVEDYKHPSGRITQFANTNKLIRFYKGCIGGKTGFTTTAGFCLSACAERSNLKVVATVVGAKDSKGRFNQVRGMFDYAFANYQNKVVYQANKSMDNKLNIKNGKASQISVCPNLDICVLSNKDKDLSTITIELPDFVKAPIKAGDIVGRAKVVTNESEYSVDLIAMEDVGKATIWDKIYKIFSKF